MYRFLYWLVLSRLPAEGTHRVSFALLRAFAAVPGMRALMHRLLAPRDPVLRVKAFGRELPGPLGLAAGFDKDAKGVRALLALGFGFVEVGTVTAEAQPGNPRPRLFRLRRDRRRPPPRAPPRRDDRRQHRQDEACARRGGARRLHRQRREAGAVRRL